MIRLALERALALSLCAVVNASAAEIWVDARSSAAKPDGSPAAPHKSIAAAVEAAVRPGDSIIIKAGTYREPITKLPSGEPGKPVTIKAAPGERVVVSGAVQVSQWTTENGVLRATVPVNPARVLLNNRELPVSREPDESWWVATGVEGSVEGGGDGGSITDPAHLKTLKADPAGATAYVWAQKGNLFADFPVASIDRATGKLQFAEGGKKKPALTANDKYYLKNLPAFVNRPGEWAATSAADGKFTLHLQPPEGNAQPSVEVPASAEPVLPIANVHDLVIDGLEITGGLKNGIDILKAQRITIANCIVHNNDYMGIAARETEDLVIRNSISARNEYGVSVSFSRNALVAECEIGWNGTDGLIFSWKSDGVTLRNSYIHDHMLWGHPDNLQIYRDVKNVKIADNLVMTSGQSLMTEETTAGELRGNMFVGSMANMVLFGHGNAGDYTLKNNTFAFAGYGAIALSFKDYRISDNIFFTGHSKPSYSTKGIQGYVGDRNLFWNSARVTASRLLASDAGFHGSLAAFQEATGQDRASVNADPKFVSAPVAGAVLDDKLLSQSTRDTLHLRGGTASFKAGDWIEINFDGVKRRVKAVEGTAIVVDPPLAERPTKGWIIANWAAQQDFKLDLRLADGSPARTLGEGGKPVGSAIHIAAYRAGDFNGDGIRDIPTPPPGLLD